MVYRQSSFKKIGLFVSSEKTNELQKYVKKRAKQWN